MTLPMFGISFNWGAQYSRVTPILEKLGLGKAWLGLAWIGSPISGAFVQPWVGYLSDNCTCRWGRRRIWMLAMLLALAVVNMALAFAPNIVAYLSTETGRVADVSEQGLQVACAIAVLSFWFCDCCINAVQAPCRSLISDLLPASQVLAGAGYLGFWEGLGKVSAFAIGSIGGDSIERFFPTLCETSGTFFAGVQVLFVVGNLLAVSSVLLCVLAVEERRHFRRPGEEGLNLGIGSVMASAWEVAGELSTLSRIIWMALGFMNFTWSAAVIYIPSFVGTDVFGGDPAAPHGSESERRYIQGVTLASVALVVQSVLSLAASPAIGELCRAVGETRVWVLCLIWHAAVLNLATGLPSNLLSSHPHLMACLLGLQGLPWAAFMVIPYGIAGREAQCAGSRSGKGGQEGLFTSIMNLALCAGTLSASLVTGPATWLAQDSSAGPLAVAGGFCLMAAIVLSWRLTDRDGQAVVRGE